MLAHIVKNNRALILLLIISFSVHFVYLDYPNEVVFDEVHFGKFASAYYTGNYYFDIHPPLGKLILAGGGKLTGFKPGFGFENIGSRYPDYTYYGLRLLPALAGSLIPLVIYLILRTLKVSKKISLLGMFLAVFESSVLIQSRFILIDAFLLLFGLLGILFYLKSRERIKNRVGFFLLSGLFLGASVSIKWTGLIFWFMVFLASISDIVKILLAKKNWIKPVVTFFASAIVIPVLIYMSVFYIHFGLLPYAGTGDAFMTQKFQAALVNNSNYNQNAQMGFFEKFLELNHVMLTANAGITTGHPYGVRWYSMPLMDRSVYYWTRSEGAATSRIYLLGNPFIWWPVFVGILFFSGKLVFRLVRRKFGHLKNYSIGIFFLLAYFLNILTYAFISRVIFLYHYFPSLVLGIVIFCIAFEKPLTKKTGMLGSKKKTTIALWLLVTAVGLGFLFFSPLTYGMPLDKFSYELRNWLPSWV